MTRKANGARERKKANGCGCLEKRGGVWRARWMVDGKTFTKSTGTGDRRKAEAVLASLVAPTQAKDEKERLENMAARIAGRDAEIRAYEEKRPALSVADAFTAYKDHPEAPGSTGAGTLSVYESQHGRLVRWLENNRPEVVEMRDVTQDVAYAFLRDLSASTSPNTYNKYVTLFTRIWDVLDGNARLDGANPWRKAKKKAVAASDRRELTMAELVRIGETATGEMARLCAIGVYTGLRLGDAATLDWGRVDLAKNHIAVVPRKTRRYSSGRPVIIPIVPPFRKLLLSVPPDERVGPLCPEICKKYERDRAAVTNMVQRLFEACGISTTVAAGDNGHRRVAVGFHSFRHTFVTVAAENNVPLAIVQAIVGHTSPAMTRHYTHVHENVVQAQMAAFPSVFNPALDGAPVAALEAPEAVSEAVSETVEAETVESVRTDAATLAKLDALRLDGETRADALRRIIEAAASGAESGVQA